MDLNRQALLVTGLVILTPAALGHAARPGQLARTIRAQGVLPRVLGGSRAAGLYAGVLVVAELAVTGVAAVSLAGSHTRWAGVSLALGGLGFVGYVGALLEQGYRGDCGCSPVSSALTPLSLAPGAALALVGIVLALDRPFDGVALAETSGALQTTLALGAAGLLGGLLAVLPATALTDDPMALRPEEDGRR